MSINNKQTISDLSTYVFNEHLTPYIASNLSFIELNKLKCISKHIFNIIKESKFMKDYYLKIMRYKDFNYSNNIDYEFALFKKQIYEPRVKIIKRLEKRGSYIWDAKNRICSKCKGVAYPIRLSDCRIKCLLKRNQPICFCINSSTKTLMENEEIKLNKDLENLEKKMSQLELKINNKKQELYNHKQTHKLTLFKKYLKIKEKTLKHGRQKNQHDEMIIHMNYEEEERYNPQYLWLAKIGKGYRTRK